MATLEEIRKKLEDAENQNRSREGSANDIYPFWNIPDGSTATVRFLPDGDPLNTLFWVERLVIRLPFAGTTSDPSKKVQVQVLCVEMWDEACPILTEIRPWFKDPDLEALGRTYWKKRSYIFQGFVVNDPIGETEVPENPIRRFVINKSIYEIIKASLMDAEMEEVPTDYTAGRDFKLTKTKRGQYADYSTSSWSMRTRALSDEEMAAINEHNLFDLKDYLPKKPSQKELEIITEMFHASVNGELYDEEAWSSFYRTTGYFKAQATSSTTTSSPKKTSKKVEGTEDDNDSKVEESPKAAKPSTSAMDKLKARTEEIKEEEDSPSDEKPDPKKILAMIKDRTKSNS